MLSFLSAIFLTASYYILYKFLYKLIINNNTNEAKLYGYTIILLLFSASALYILSALFTHIVAFRLETNLRKKGIEGLSEAGFSFFDFNSSGKIRKIIDDNTEQTHMIVAHLIPDNASALISPIALITVAFLIDIKIGLILMILSLIAFYLMTLMSGNKEFMVLYQEALEKMSSETVEYIRGIQVIKIFNSTIYSFKNLYEAIMSYSKYALNYSLSCRIPFCLFQIIFLGIIAILLPFTVFFTKEANSKLYLIKLIMILFLSGALFTSFMKIMYVQMHAFLGASAINKLENIFDEMLKEKISFGNKEKFKNFDIKFEDVSFAYTDKYVLKNLSFELKEKKTYALIGKSGSGKSTIVKLISGFYKASSGKIKIAGENIQNYSEKAIMKNIAFVFQNSKLFKKSIYENVKIGNPDATKEEVLEAMKLAGCDNILNKFKDRENTEIGTKGVYLSGGEKQRITIARAILKNAQIIILDEASAAVDSENEYLVQQAFANLIKDKTVIIIAHRISTVKNVDEILVVEDGKIVERGNHSELISQNGKYRYFQELYKNANEWRLRHE